MGILEGGFEEKGLWPIVYEWISLIYSDQYAEIFLEGYRSSAIMVQRGVRQGCPLSSLLFNIVIATLAIAIWEMAAISGVRTPMSTHKLVLYADDIFCCCKVLLTRSKY